MPALLDLVDGWRDQLFARDCIVHADMLLGLGFTRGAIEWRVRTGRWRRLLPETYLVQPGEPYRRQLLIAALTWAGLESSIDGLDACRFHALLPRAAVEDEVRLAVPADAVARSRDFVVVRRSAAPLQCVDSGLARYLAVGPALVAAACGMRSQQEATALITSAVQRRAVSPSELARLLDQGPVRGRRQCRVAIEAAAGGAHSLPEADARALMLESKILPRVLFNQRLQLPCGRIVVPDALIPDAGVIHEVNGRRWHAEEDQFESMQERHDVMTVAGLIVLHNSPRRLAAGGPRVLREVEQTYLRYAGRGLPAGVRLL